MTTCMPIKELKNTAAFSEAVARSDGPIIITRNGREDFAVMKIEDLNALRLEASRARLYQLVGEGESDLASGRVVSAADSQADLRDRYGL